jgi:hypothetical protein
MKSVSPIRWLPAFQWLAGAGDTATGALLLVAPTMTLKWMGVQQLPQPIEFASFIGAFVLGVGLTYLWAARWPRDAKTAARWQTLWTVTALIRSLVAGFLTWQLLAGRLEKAWVTVALTDGTLAVFQWTGLKLGWLEFKD